MSLKRFSRLALVAVALALVVSHCGQSESTPDSPSAGAGGASGTAGVGGHAGTSASAGTLGKAGSIAQGGKSQAGTGGQGGNIGKAGEEQGGGGGAIPSLSFELAGKVWECDFYRLATPGHPQLLSWKPCDWASDCEEAVFDTQPFPWEPGWFGRPFVVKDLGDGARVSFLVGDKDDRFHYFVFHEDGSILDAWEIDKPCSSGGFALRGEQFGWQVTHPIQGIAAQYGGVMGKMGGGPLVSFESIVVPSYPPVRWLFSEDRWAWGWGSGFITSVSTSNPPQQVVFAESDNENGPIYDNHNPTTDGKKFIFSTAVAHPTLGYTKKLSISDGVQSPKDYFVPEEQIDVGSPQISGGFLAWRQGYGRKDLNLYEKAELWSSPYDPDPSKLKPHKVKDLNNDFSVEDSRHLGDWGYMARFSDTTVLELVHLATDKVFTVNIPPTEQAGQVGGISKTHVWFSTVIPGGTTYKAARYARYKLPIPP